MVADGGELREETNFTEYYEKLDEVEALPVRTVTGPEDGYLASLYDDPKASAYHDQRKAQDEEILGRLKQPSFRRIDKKNSKEKDGGEDAGEVIDRRYTKFGFHDPHSHKEGRRSLETYTRSDQSRYGLVSGNLRYDAPFEVLYDMDEQDDIFLQRLNGLREKKEPALRPVSREQFEIIMTFIEMQFFFLEQLLPPPTMDEEALNQRQILRASLYGSDDGQGVAPEEDQCCAVCNRNDCDSANQIVFCDGCNIAVHQDCYGIAFIPEGPWLCRRCLISRNQNERCLFCPSTTGAFKQTDNGYWAHVTCSLFINELYFANPIYMEPIEGLQDIPKGRWRLTCYICKKKIGACIQCCHSQCFQAYHVTCARRADMYMKMTKGLKGALDDKTTLVSYCDKHTPREWAANHDTEMGIERTRLYYSLGAEIHEETTQVPTTAATRKEMRDTRADLFRWKTHKGAPVVPQTFIKRLEAFLEQERIGIDDAGEFLRLVSQYWTLKREVNRLPLIKRPDPTNYATLTNEEVKQRVSVLKLIKADVSQLHEMASETRNRTQLEAEINAETTKQLELCYFPKLYAVDQLGRSLLRSDKSHVLQSVASDSPSGAELVSQIRNKSYNSVQALIDDIQSVSSWVLENCSKSSGAYRLFKVTWGKSKKARYQEALAMERYILDGGMDEVYRGVNRDGLHITEKGEDALPVARRVRYPTPEQATPTKKPKTASQKIRRTPRTFKPTISRRLRHRK